MIFSSFNFTTMQDNRRTYRMYADDLERLEELQKKYAGTSIGASLSSMLRHCIKQTHEEEILNK